MNHLDSWVQRSKESEENWSTFEQKGYAIYQAFKKLDYVFYNDQPTHAFTDHRNLLFVFAQLALEPALGRQVVDKVQSWALFLSQVKCLIEHVDGESSVFVDILTRWLKGYRLERRTIKTFCMLARVDGRVNSPTDKEFVWASFDMFRSSHHKCRQLVNNFRLKWDSEERLLKTWSVYGSLKRI